MREANFSLPAANRAALSITTQLYDRRALDCTSDLPLINSLNHLAYLTISSARIRDILTVDGGIERLVCVLKQGRSQDSMIGWKWNLAFQCVVNVGVRGSEDVRRRVVEADMIPVIATVLDSYIQICDRVRRKRDGDKERGSQNKDWQSKTKSRSRERGHGATMATPTQSSEDRQQPNRMADSIHVPQSENATNPQSAARTFRRCRPNLALISVPATTTAQAPDDAEQTDHPSLSENEVRATEPDEGLHQDESGQIASGTPVSAANPLTGSESLLTLSSPSNIEHPSTDQQANITIRHELRHGASLTFNLAPLPRPDQQASRPESPATPQPPRELRSIAEITFPAAAVATMNDRETAAHRFSSGEIGQLADFVNDPIVATRAGPLPVAVDETVSIRGEDEPDVLEELQPTGTIPDEINMAGTTHLHSSPRPVNLEDSQTQADPVERNVHQTILGQRTTQVQPLRAMRTHNFTDPINLRPMAPLRAMEEVVKGSPREEDVLMSLQLLAYVSKYCNLRSYFHKTHLVPALQVRKELYKLSSRFERGLVSQLLDHPDRMEGELSEKLQSSGDAELSFAHESDEDEDEEYLLSNDYNIFPLIEKYTVRYVPEEMRYWAGVVMRNLCRKDESRGGIRQCAFYKCGRWEAYPRQFAKCRRCRRTKYCSKDCQKNAWVFHRHWCVAVSNPEPNPEAGD